MNKIELTSSFPFGKYKGIVGSVVARTNPSYIRWFKNNVTTIKISDDVWKLAVCTGIMQSEERADKYGTPGDFGFDNF